MAQKPVGDTRHTLQSHLMVLLASILVAGSFIPSDHLAGQLHPISLTLLRFVIASICLLPFLLLRKSFFKQVVSVLPRASVLSFFYAAFFIGMFEALTITSTLNTATLYTLVPLITAIIASIWLKETIDGKRLLVYLFGAIGTLWVIFEGEWQSLLSLSLNRGDGIFLLSSISMCCYAVCMKFYYRNDDLWIFVWCTLLGAVIWLAVALMFLSQPLEWTQLSLPLWWDVAYLALFTTLLTAYLYQRATVCLGPLKVTAYVYLNPALVALLAFFVDGSTIDTLVVPGIIVSVIATFLLVQGR